MQGRLRRLSKEEVREADKEIEQLAFSVAKKLKSGEDADEKLEAMKELVSSLKLVLERMGMVRSRRTLDNVEQALNK